MTPGLLLVAALATALAAQDRAAPRASPLAAPAAPRPDRPGGTGAVVHATAERLYLDVGVADGLREGAEVLVVRRDGQVRCRIDLVAEHHASCAAAGARAGDPARFAAAATEAPPPPKLLPPPQGEAALARAEEALASATFEKVAFRRPEGARVVARRERHAVDAALSHASFLATTAGASHVERLDVAIRSAELGGGVRLDVGARAERWLRRERPRFRPGDATRLHVWQAQLTVPAGDALTFAAGRILPWEITGATVFDGASAAVRAGPVELGLFGGAVPEPDTLEPTTRRATGGAFWLLDRPVGAGASLRHEGRLAVVRSPELGTRVEATLAARAYLRAVDVSAEAQLGAGDVHAAGYLDAARLDLVARPAPAVVIGGGFRHAGLEWPAQLEPPRFPGRTRAADLFASWALVPAVRVGLTAGRSEDVASGLDRTWAGPELALPRLLGRRGGLTLGYLEERGWLDGRSAYAQLVARPFDRLRLIGRASWFHDAGLGSDRNELGLLASAAADLGRGLGLRVTLLGRGALASVDRADAAAATTVTATLHGAY